MIKRAIPYVLAAGILAILVSQIEMEALLASFLLADRTLIAFAASLLVANVWFQFAKWKTVVHAVKPDVPERELWLSLFSGFSFAMVTPVRIGEFGARAWAIPSSSQSLLIGLTVVDKFFSAIVTVVFGVYGLTVFFVGQHALPAWTIPVALMTGIAIAASLIIGLGNVPSLLSRVGELTLLHRWKHRFAAASEAMKKIDRWRAFVLFFWTVLFYCTFVIQFFLLLNAFGDSEGGITLAAIATIMVVKTVIPSVTFGELGIREGVAVFFLPMIGIAAAHAFNAAMLLFTLNVFLPAVVGTIAVSRLPVTRRIVT